MAKVGNDIYESPKLVEYWCHMIWSQKPIQNSRTITIQMYEKGLFQKKKMYEKGHLMSEIRFFGNIII